MSGAKAFLVVPVLAAALLRRKRRAKDADEESKHSAVVAAVRSELDALRSELLQALSTPAASPTRKKTRVYMDGCFDLMHFGHCNALRQAAALGDTLVVGCCAAEEIIPAKGAPPILTDEERYAALRACKFVDEVVEGVPYDLTSEWLDHLFDKYDIDYIVHGDDPCIGPDGQDVYAVARKMGKFREIKRTEGISTTGLVGRLLGAVDGEKARSPSQFLPTSRRFVQFAPNRSPTAEDNVVYIAGGFDLFNIAHATALERAKQFGTFLIVGVHSDEAVRSERGDKFPITGVAERALSVMSCRHVDEVVVGAPLHLTKDLIVSLNISCVVRGTVSDAGTPDDDPQYAVAKEMGILKEFTSPSSLTTDVLLDRCRAMQATLAARFAKKAAKEAAYVDEKKFVEEG